MMLLNEPMSMTSERLHAPEAVRHSRWRTPPVMKTKLCSRTSVTAQQVMKVINNQVINHRDARPTYYHLNSRMYGHTTRASKCANLIPAKSFK
jgi:hypothetical protein